VSGVRDQFSHGPANWRHEGEPGARAEDDRHWHTFFDVILKPNPALGPSQRETIAA
jgi:hypothetical protein